MEKVKNPNPRAGIKVERKKTEHEGDLHWTQARDAKLPWINKKHGTSGLTIRVCMRVPFSDDLLAFLVEQAEQNIRTVPLEISAILIKHMQETKRTEHAPMIKQALEALEVQKWKR